MKKLALVLAAVGAILAVVVAVLYFRSPGEVIDLGGADSPYPYTCELKHQKLHVHITGDFPEGYTWTAGTNDSGVLVVKRKWQTKDGVTFSLVPQSSGIAGAVFTLEKEGDLPDRIFQITCGFLLDGDGKVAEADSSYLEMPGAVGGEGEGFTYSVAQINACTLQVSVRGDGEWRCERVGIGAEVNGSLGKQCFLTDAEDEQPLHELKVVAANNEGDGTLYIDSGNRHIELTYHCTDDGEISLTGHKLGNGDTSARRDEFDQQYGEIAGRLNYLLGEQSVGSWRSRADDAAEFPVGLIKFNNFSAWTLYVSREAAEADFVGEATAAVRFATAGLTANIYEDDAGVRSAWQAGELNYMLESTEAGREECKEITAWILSTLGN